MFNGEEHYEVRRTMVQDTIHLDKTICYCGEWDLTGIPCKHGAYSIVVSMLMIATKRMHSWQRKYIQSNQLEDLMCG